MGKKEEYIKDQRVSVLALYSFGTSPSDLYVSECLKCSKEDVVEIKQWLIKMKYIDYIVEPDKSEIVITKKGDEYLTTYDCWFGMEGVL